MYITKTSKSLLSAGPLVGCADDLLGSHQFTPKGWSSPATFRVTRGDYSPLMKLVAENLDKAKVCVLVVPHLLYAIT